MQLLTLKPQKKAKSDNFIQIDLQPFVAIATRIYLDCCTPNICFPFKTSDVFLQTPFEGISENGMQKERDFKTHKFNAIETTALRRHDYDNTDFGALISF